MREGSGHRALDRRGPAAAVTRWGRPVPLRARRRQRRQRMAVLQAGQAHPETGEARELGRPSARPRSPRRRRPVPRESRRSPTSARPARTAPHPVVSAGVARPGRGSPLVRRSAVGTRRARSGVSVSPEGRPPASSGGGRSLRPTLPCRRGSCPGLLRRDLDEDSARSSHSRRMLAGAAPVCRATTSPPRSTSRVGTACTSKR